MQSEAGEDTAGEGDAGEDSGEELEEGSLCTQQPGLRRSFLIRLQDAGCCCRHLVLCSLERTWAQEPWTAK